jgi:hypothetical protein
MMGTAFCADANAIRDAQSINSSVAEPDRSFMGNCIPGAKTKYGNVAHKNLRAIARRRLND